MKNQTKNHITDNENISDFFSFISKAVIIIPIFILIASLFLRFAAPKKPVPISNTVSPTVTPVEQQQNMLKFDLKGPIVCDSLFIQDKKILLKSSSTNYLLNGDCVYIWNKGSSNGEKKCGLSSYMGMTENYLSFFNINDLINNNMVKDMIKDRGIDPNEIIKSCKREAVKDKTIFEIPKQALFKNK